MGDFFQMRRVAARPVFTQMMKLSSVFDWPHQRFKNKAMNKIIFLFTANDPIPSGAFSFSPDPAIHHTRSLRGRPVPSRATSGGRAAERLWQASLSQSQPR
jgi:hypothetical protein